MTLAKVDPVDLRPVGVKLVLDRDEVGLALHDAAPQPTQAPVQIAGLPRRRVTLGGLLRQPGGAGQHPCRADIHIHQLDPVAGEHELPDLIRMGCASRLQHEQQPVAFTVGLDVAQQQPGVHQ